MEYNIITGTFDSPQSLEDAVNKIAVDGWRLHSINGYSEDADGYGSALLVFEREKA